MKRYTLFQRKACDVIESGIPNLYLYNNERMLGQIEELKTHHCFAVLVRLCGRDAAPH